MNEETKDVFTTHEIGKICHVHQTTVINWIKSKKLDSYTTPGGHRRVRRNDLIRFLKKNGMPTNLGDAVSSDRRVLIVDHNQGALHGLRDVLSSKGCAVEAASNPFEAGHLMARFEPNLMIMDFEMPGLNIEGACQLIKAEGGNVSIPIIGIGADPRIAVEMEIEAVIRKPIQPPILLATCLRILGLED